uniref:Uncharacterized protein n=1 Tax=Chelonoidis abingdonii TaxID=106734 RepID=A0A8C0H1P7_CHEAB
PCEQQCCGWPGPRRLCRETAPAPSPRRAGFCPRVLGPGTSQWQAGGLALPVETWREPLRWGGEEGPRSQCDALKSTTSFLPVGLTIVQGYIPSFLRSADTRHQART